MFGKIYETTWWGNPTINAWGNIYYDLAQTEPLLIINFRTRVLADSGTIESIECIEAATPSIIEDN
tara:strand:- start:321 stop:518 length:198 start_codon:yes stop_codon:yes gene_type:complete